MQVDRRKMLRAALAVSSLGSSSLLAEVNTDSAAGRGLRRPSEPEPTGNGVVRRKRYDRHPRILLVTLEDDTRSRETLQRLQAEDGDFAVLRDRGWLIGRTLNSHIQLIDLWASARYIPIDPTRTLPWAVCLQFGRVLRSSTERPVQQINAQMLHWLLTGNEQGELNLTAGNNAQDSLRYPAHGGTWSVQGDDHPIQDVLLSHLKSRMHVYRIPRDWKLDQWSYLELRTLHDDLHRWGRARSLIAVR